MLFTCTFKTNCLTTFMIFHFLHNTEASLETLVDNFQRAVSNHYEDGGPPLYNVQTMRNFTEKHSPGLYNRILNSITRQDSRTSHDRKVLQEQRTVALLHIIAYFRYCIFFYSFQSM